MMEQVQNVQDKATNVVEPVVGFGKKTVYLGFGAAGLTADKVKELWGKSHEWSDKAIERGEDLAGETQHKVTEIAKEPQKFAEENWKRVTETWEKYSGKVLKRGEVPAETEIEVVTEKVAKLEKKMDKATDKPVATVKKETKVVKTEVEKTVDGVVPETL